MSIEVDNVSKVRRGAVLLDEVSLKVGPGAIVGVMGPNGSGKTMVMRAVLGLIHVDRGTVTVDGRQVGAGVPFPESVGALIENPAFLPRHSGRENLRLLTAIRGGVGRSAIEEAMREVGLEGALTTAYGKYSLGMKQRLGIAAAIVERPANVVLDEPTNALDASGIAMLQEVLLRQRERGAAVLWSCHDTGLLKEMSDEVYCMQDGRVVDHEAL